MRVPRPSSRAALAGIAAALIVVIVGAIALVAGGGSALKEQIETAVHSPLPAPALSVSGVHHGKGSIKKPVTMQITNGILTKVTLRQSVGGKIPGAFNKTKTRWRAAHRLAPSSRIIATTMYAD